MDKNFNKKTNNCENLNNFKKIDYKKSLGQNFLYDTNLLVVNDTELSDLEFINQLRSNFVSKLFQ